MANRVFTYMAPLGRLRHFTRIHTDYNVARALQARDLDDEDYFTTVLPEVSLSVGLVADAPVPPSARGWTRYRYPALYLSEVGELASDVQVTPRYPLEAPWSDPNPDDIAPAAYVGEAPDGSAAIEIRYTMGVEAQFVDALFPLLPSPGCRHAGVSFEVWTESGFEFGAIDVTGGEAGGGMWGGSHEDNTRLTPPWDQQGIALRNIWSAEGVPAEVTSGGAPVTSGLVVVTNGGGIDQNIRLYSYNLNRPLTVGTETVGLIGQWATGQWQTIEYEGFINHPGHTNGFARMWIDGVCIGEITGAIWSLNDEFLWRGPMVSDAWSGHSLQVQKRWVRNLRAYHP